MTEENRYLLYKADISYFSGKIEAYLRYKQIPHDAIEVTMKIMNEVVYPQTGVRKIPIMKTPSGDWLFDSTPMIRWLENQHSYAPVVPPDPALAFVASLLEDYGDEWLWRPAMWWRWMPVPSRRALGFRIASMAQWPRPLTELLSVVFGIRQRQEWLFRDGVTRQNEQQVRDHYLHELDFLQSVLEKQPWILGQQPSVADYGFYGAMFRHFSNDPDPAEIMRRRAPAVYEWTARMWNADYRLLDTEQQWQWPEGNHWLPEFNRITNDYLPYLQKNAEAWAAGKKRFNFTGQSIEFPKTVTTQYRVWCLQKLQREYRALSIHDRTRVEQLFASDNLANILAGKTEIDSELDQTLALPRDAVTETKKPGLWLSLWGQARN